MAIARVADTSWLYALFDADDAHHETAAAEVRTPLITLVPTAILNETLDLVKYRAGKDAARKALESLESFPHFDLWFQIDARDAVRVWAEHRHLSFHDAHAVALARKTGFPLQTFDRRQAAAV